MSAVPTAPSGISRRSLGRRRILWTATGVVYITYALALAVFALIPALELREERVLPLSLLMGVIGAVHLVTRPAPMDSPLTHLDLAAMAACFGLSVVALSPEAVLSLTAAMFAGPLVAIRLVDRGQIAAHLLLVTAALIVPALLVPADQSTQRALLTMIPAMWALAAGVTVGLERMEAQGDALGRLARMDPLTGIANRQLLDEALTAEVRARAGRQLPLSILMLDLNGFRHLNETVGYAAGDQVLQEVAGVIVSSVPPQALVARYGGDEFVIVVPAGPETARGIAATIHRSLAKLTVEGVPVTTGLGIASCPEDSTHPGVLLQIAVDRLMADKGGSTAERRRGRSADQRPDQANSG